MDERNIIINVGFPASGKSTHAKSQGCYIVGRDGIRKMLNVEYSQKVEAIVKKIELFAVEQILKTGKDLIIDNTNLTKKIRAPYLKLAKKYNYTPIIRHIATPVKDCIMRDRLRENKVGEEAILRMHELFLRETQRFDEVIECTETIQVAEVVSQDLLLADMLSKNLTIAECEHEFTKMGGLAFTESLNRARIILSNQALISKIQMIEQQIAAVDDLYQKSYTIQDYRECRVLLNRKSDLYDEYYIEVT